MFDFSRIAETLSGLLRETGIASNAGNLVDLLGNAALDPKTLEGLSHTQLLDVLTQHGIDPTTLSADRVQTLLDQLGIGQQADTLSSLLGAGADRPQT
jgi:hypothetical protein